METLLEYYNFSGLFKDKSGYFNDHMICYSLIRENLYLVFEDMGEDGYKLWFVQFPNSESIGSSYPEASNLLIDKFKIDLKEHRELLQKYLDYN